MSFVLMGWAGLQQILQPPYLAHICVFFLIVTFWARNASQRNLLGGVFIALLLLSGFAGRSFLDLMLIPLSLPFDKVYFVLGIVLLFFGLGFLCDWLKCHRLIFKRDQFFFSFTTKSGQKTQPFVLFIKTGVVALIAVILGQASVAVALSHRWAHYAANAVLDPTMRSEALGMLFAYETGIVLPLILGLIIGLFLKNKNWNQSFLKALASGVFITVGCSLIYLY